MKKEDKEFIHFMVSVFIGGVLGIIAIIIYFNYFF